MDGMHTHRALITFFKLESADTTRQQVSNYKVYSTLWILQGPREDPTTFQLLTTLPTSPRLSHVKRAKKQSPTMLKEESLPDRPPNLLRHFAQTVQSNQSLSKKRAHSSTRVCRRFAECSRLLPADKAWPPIASANWLEFCRSLSRSRARRW